MSDKSVEMHPYTALGIANQFRALIFPDCIRTNLAGSIRRGESEVHDIEIICEPTRTPVLNIFGDVVSWTSNLDDLMDSLLITGEICKRADKHGRPAWGSKYKRLSYKGFPIDLFAVIPPAQYGVIMMIRTGPAEFSHKMVTPRYLGGLMPNEYQVKDGALWDNVGERLLVTPEERRLFDVYGMPYINPEDRKKVGSLLDVERLMKMGVA